MPQRFLRPGLRTSPRWNAVSHAAARLYISILTQVDDWGRYDGRNAVLHSDAFAVWNEQNPKHVVSPQDSAALSCELSAAKLLFFYEVDGRKYLQLIQWEERARGKSKWPEPPKDNPLRNPAESCGILPPSPLAIALSHEPEPSVARAPEFAESPSWKEFWDYCKSPACSLVAEWFARDKFLAAESDNWAKSRNWRAYANRCKGWWESDGRPMTNPKQNNPEFKRSGGNSASCIAPGPTGRCI